MEYNSRSLRLFFLINTTPVQNGVINPGNTIILMVSRNMFSQSCAKYHAEFR
jgi:hypothetical protein